MTTTQELLEKAAITELIHRYQLAIDSHDAVLWASTFAEDGEYETPFGHAKGTEQLIGAISFYERREVKDLLAYLRLIANPADDEAFLRVVNVPKRGIGDASLAVLARAGDRAGRDAAAVEIHRSRSHVDVDVARIRPAQRLRGDHGAMGDRELPGADRDVPAVARGTRIALGAL